MVIRFQDQTANPSNNPTARERRLLRRDVDLARSWAQDPTHPKEAHFEQLGLRMGRFGILEENIGIIESDTGPGNADRSIEAVADGAAEADDEADEAQEAEAAGNPGRNATATDLKITNRNPIDEDSITQADTKPYGAYGSRYWVSFESVFTSNSSRTTVSYPLSAAHENGV